MPARHLDFFFKHLLPVPLILAGLATNLFIILTYSRPKFRKTSIRHIWRLLAAIDAFCLLQLLRHYIKYQFGITLEETSPALCKLLIYFSHISAISAHLLVYISIDRMLTILFPHLIKALKRHQAIILLSIVGFNLSFFSQRLVYQVLVSEANTTNATCMKSATYKTAFLVFEWLDLAIASILPFAVMILCTLFLTLSIQQSRSRIITPRCSTAARRRINKDIKFAVTLVLLDVTFIVTNLPIQVFFLAVSAWTSEEFSWFYLLDSLYYLGFVTNFFIYMLVNSGFRKEFLVMTRLDWVIMKTRKYIATSSSTSANTGNFE